MSAITSRKTGTSRGRESRPPSQDSSASSDGIVAPRVKRGGIIIEPCCISLSLPNQFADTKKPPSLKLGRRRNGRIRGTTRFGDRVSISHFAGTGRSRYPTPVIGGDTDHAYSMLNRIIRAIAPGPIRRRRHPGLSPSPGRSGGQTCDYSLQSLLVRSSLEHNLAARFTRCQHIVQQHSCSRTTRMR